MLRNLLFISSLLALPLVGRGQEVPAEAEEVPDEWQEVPDEAQEVPDEAEEVPDEWQEVPDEAQEVPDEAEEAYRAVIEDAVARSRAGQLPEALALFLRAHELQPSARTWRGIGLVRFGLRDYTGAIAALSASLDDPRRPLDEGQRAEAERAREEARRFVATLTVAVDPPSATLVVNGADPVREPSGAILLNPGRHELRATAEGHRPETRTVSVEGGTTRTLSLNLLPRTVAAAPDASADRRVPLVVRGPAELTLHATPLSAEGAPDPLAVSQVCAAPCESRLPAGLYRLGLRQGEGGVHDVEDVRLEAPVEVTMHFASREVVRTVGWVVGGVGLLAGAGLGLAALFPSNRTDRELLGGLAGAVSAAFVVVALPLVLLGDHARIEVVEVE